MAVGKSNKSRQNYIQNIPISRKYLSIYSTEFTAVIPRWLDVVGTEKILLASNNSSHKVKGYIVMLAHSYELNTYSNSFGVFYDSNFPHKGYTYIRVFSLLASGKGNDRL